MTNEEAISRIRTIMGASIGSSVGASPRPIVYAFDIAIKAIEKQIPEKPVLKRIDDEDEQTGEKYFWNFWLCPVCGEHIGVKYNSFCSGCGQAIDWGEEK